jgi:hypothetical protein
MVKSLLLLTVILALVPGAVLADSTTYSYISTPFNSFSGTTCPPTCNITGSFTVAMPFPPNQMQDIGGSGSFTPLSFSFTEGTITWTNLNTVDSGFAFDTDSLGKITFYSFFADLANGSDVSVFFDGPTELTQLFASNNAGGYSASFSSEGASGGTWTSETMVSTPEPSSLRLLGIGLIALLVLWKKSFGLQRPLASF